MLTLTKLKAGVELNVGYIESAIFNGTDPTQHVVTIMALIQETTAAVIKLEVNLTATLNGKFTEIVALLVVIINAAVKGLCTASDEITLQVFLGLVAQTDAVVTRYVHVYASYTTCTICVAYGSSAIYILSTVSYLVPPLRYAALKALLVAIVNLDATVLAFVGACVDAVKLLQVGLNACANTLGLN
ncbi:hypothetical protein BDV93DRAFT_555282 [Ceratobasidium sp. AG-I]|nr:hypothetical protein BDV93DRAFT_555282 [Ceratobasidium sp. AG-I]